MPAKDTRLGAYIEKELEKYRGVYVPVRMNALLCQFKRSARLKRLHPNPDDEFCDPKIGPNYEIIGRYEHDFREAKRHSHLYCDDPLIVEKMRPDGFLILNGHHRWGAALRLGYKRIRIKCVNLAQETDIEKILAASSHTKRLTLDLDEVVFARAGDPEEKLPLFGRLYRERLRKGVPALIHFFARRGWDIWVYSASYYSMDYIRALFRCYRISVSGILTGTQRKADEKARRRVEKLFSGKYETTLHIDRETMLLTHSGSDEYEEYKPDAGEEDWSLGVMKVMDREFKGGK